MLSRPKFSNFCHAVAVGCLLIIPASAQTVRFDTNVGNIDFLLNPGNDANLQGHVDNILLYVNSGLYDLSVINRAAEGFVLQYGGFTLDPLVVPNSFDAFTDIPSFDPVIVDQDGDGTVDFTALSNSTGTVSLALNANGPNSGTSSFFVNLGNNTGLDDQGFVPFAEVVDMTTVDLIMALPQINLDGGGLAGDDVPTVNGGVPVFIERAFVLLDQGSTGATTFSTLTLQEAADDDPIAANTFSTLVAATDETGSAPMTLSVLTAASDTSEIAPFTFSTLTPNSATDSSGVVTMSLPSVSSASAASFQSSSLQALTVPEPPALVLAVAALMAIAVMKRSKIG